MAPRKAIFYHQQWDTYGDVDEKGVLLPQAKDANGFNIATSTGRNYQISDIPDDVTDLAYAFWWVDANGNVASGDDDADHEKPPTPSDGSAAVWPDPLLGLSVYLTSPGFTAYQSPPTRGSVLGSKNPRYIGNFGAILALNAARQSRNVPKLNVSLTIGGWTYSTYFSDAVKPGTVDKFVNSCMHAILLWNDIFTGINFDWEYISANGANLGTTGNTVYNTALGTYNTQVNHSDPNDAVNFSNFLRLLRAALKVEGYFTDKPFSIGIPVTPAPQKAQYDINLLHPYVDQVHVMTYDLHSGAFDYITGFHSNPYSGNTSTRVYPSPAYSTEDAIKYYLGLSGQVSNNPNQPGFIGAGLPGDPTSPVPLPSVPARKLFLGVAFYSRGFAQSGGVYSSPVCNSATMCSVVGLPQAVYAPGDSNSIPYNQVVTTCGSGNWGPITIDDISNGGTYGAYCYNQTDKQFLSFDNADSITEKLKLVDTYNLGGVIVWDNASDIRGTVTNADGSRTSPQGSLTNVITSSPLFSASNQ